MAQREVINWMRSSKDDGLSFMRYPGEFSPC